MSSKPSGGRFSGLKTASRAQAPTAPAPSADQGAEVGGVQSSPEASAPTPAAPPAVVAAPRAPRERAAHAAAAAAGVRQGKKAVSGYFSPDVSKGLHMLALELNVSLQHLMGEAFDDLMRKHGKHPFGER